MSGVETSDPVADWQGQLHRAKSAGDRDAEIDCLLNLGAHFLDVGSDGATMHFKLAERVMVDSGHEARLHEALGGQGQALRVRGRVSEAVERFETAVLAARTAEDRRAEARWLLQKASAQRAAGDRGAADEALSEAGRIVGAVNEGDGGRGGPGAATFVLLAELNGQIGLSAYAANDAERAAECYLDAVHFALRSGEAGVISTWSVNLGNACARAHRYTEAIGHFERALDRARELPGERHVVHAALGLADTMERAYRFVEGGDRLNALAERCHDERARFALLRRALKLFEREPDFGRIIDTAQAVVELGAALRQRESAVEEARSLGERARQFRDSPPPGNPGTAVEVYLQAAMAAATRQQGDADVACEAAHLVCDVRLGLMLSGRGAWRRMLDGDIVSDPGLAEVAFIDALHLLVEAERVEDVFELLQRYKAASLCVPTLRRFAAAHDAPAGVSEFLAAAQELQLHVEALGGPAPADFIRETNAVRRAGERLLDASATLRRRDRVLNARLGGVVRREDLMDALPSVDGVAILDFVVGPERTVGLVVMRQGNDVIAALLENPHFTAEHAYDLAGRYRAANLPKGFGDAQRDAYADIGKTLHDRMFCVLAQRLAKEWITQLVLVPDASTRHLPLHLSRLCGREFDIPGIDTEEAEYLCEVMPVEYAPCLQAVVATELHRRPGGLGGVSLFADPQDDLPGARTMLERFHQSLDGRVASQFLAGPEATIGAVEQALGSADLLVFGVHGEHVVAEPAASRLEMYDGAWTMADVLALPELGRRPFIVLAACEIGAVLPTPDDLEAHGIPAALVAAGASAVLANMAPVEDISIGYLVQRFLFHLGNRSLRPSAALFRAVRDMRRLSTDDALELCRRHLEELERRGAGAKPVLAAMALQEWMEDERPEHPFADPVFWGSTVIVGSGWQLPARGLLGSAKEFRELAGQQARAEMLISAGDLETGRELAVEVAAQTDGVYRARAVATEIWASLKGAAFSRTASVRHRARERLTWAERVAVAEGDDELVRWIQSVRTFLGQEDVVETKH